MTSRQLGALRLLVVTGLPLAVLLTALALAAARWPAYWEWLAPEQAPMGFVQAIVMLGAAFCAAVLCLVAALRARPRGEVATWALLAAGVAALMADERFALHERLRDNVLAPLGPGLPWGMPGDYILLAYAVVGLLVLPRVLRLLAGDPLARGLFIVGVALAAVVVAADSFDVRRMTVATERVQQTLEEVVEGLAGSLLTGALAAHMIDRLAALAGGPGGAGAGGDPAARDARKPAAPSRSGRVGH